MADTPEGETANPGTPENNNSNPVNPTPPAQDNLQAEVERLRKEAEQARLRANQLENEKKAREEADAEAQAKKLEEQQEYKTLLEQERAKRAELESEAEKREAQAELNKAKADVLKDFDDDVREQAEELGIDLTTADEAAVTSFKEKLEKIQTRLTGTANVTPNNRRTTNAPAMPQGDDLRIALQKEDSFHEIVTKNFPGIASMTKQK